MYLCISLIKIKMDLIYVFEVEVFALISFIGKKNVSWELFMVEYKKHILVLPQNRISLVHTRSINKISAKSPKYSNTF